MRILEVITKTTPYFEKQGVDSPRLTIELLLAHLLKLKRMQLYLEFERDLDDATLGKLRELVKRRADGEPLQYIIGHVDFMGHEIAVDRRVLIPRPETELLVEVVLNRLKSTVNGLPSTVSLVDVGTGSGCIAIALAKKLSDATVYAIDSSPDALAVATANVARHQVENNVRLMEGDLLSTLPDSLQATAIVSNPPYIATGDMPGLPREVRDFEPVRALAAGEDGLEVIRRLVREARRFLSPAGFVALELGAGQREAVAAIFADNNFDVAQVEKDLQGHERVIVGVPKKQTAE